MNVRGLFNETGRARRKPPPQQTKPTPPPAPIEAEESEPVPRQNQTPIYTPTGGNNLLNKGIHNSLVSINQSCDAANWTIGCRRGTSNLTKCLRSQKPIKGLKRAARTPEQKENGVRYAPREITDTVAYRLSHPTYSKRTKEHNISNICSDKIARHAAPCFGFGAKPRRDARNKVMTVDRGTGGHKDAFMDGVVGEGDCRALDCSGFLSHVLLSAGMKPFKTNTESPVKSRSVAHVVSTTEMYGAFQGKYGDNSCLQVPQINYPGGSVSPFFFGTGDDHSIIIEPIPGVDDPFGIKRAVKSKRCNRITEKDFNFNVVQNAALTETIYHSMGPARMHVHSVVMRRKDYTVEPFEKIEVDPKGRTEPLVYKRLRNAMVTMAQQTCYLFLKGKRSVSMKSALNSLNDQVRKQAAESGKKFKGYFALEPRAQDIQCRVDTSGKNGGIKLEGGECADYCYQRNHPYG